MTVRVSPRKTIEAIAKDPTSVPGWTHSLKIHPQDCAVLEDFFARLIRYRQKIGRFS
jgi:hypothetical protein